MLERFFYLPKCRYFDLYMFIAIKFNISKLNSMFLLFTVNIDKNPKLKLGLKNFLNCIVRQCFEQYSILFQSLINNDVTCFVGTLGDRSKATDELHVCGACGERWAALTAQRALGAGAHFGCGQRAFLSSTTRARQNSHRYTERRLTQTRPVTQFYSCHSLLEGIEGNFLFY